MESDIKPEVSIVIVNWNGAKYLKKCIESLKKVKYNFELIIVDNASTDKSVEFIKSQFNNFRLNLIENQENKGFAEGNNQGVKKARGKYILFLNNDTVVKKDFLQILLKDIKKSKASAAQPLIMQYPKKNIIDSSGSYFTNTGFLYHVGHNKKYSKKYNKKTKIFSMKGACMLIKKSVLNKTGIFDPDYFAYFEETDLCHRILLSGGKIVFTPDSIIYHAGGKSSTNLQNDYVQFHSYKNRIFTYSKNFELKTLFKLLPIHISLCLIIAALYLSKGLPKHSLAILKAILWNINNIKKIKSERKKTSKIRTVKDNEYLNELTLNPGISYYYHLFSTSLAGYEDTKI